MSSQDKVERIMKKIHLLFSEGEPVLDDDNKVIVDRAEMFSALANLNMAIYEVMDQYEATTQARELAQRRQEKRDEARLAKVSDQVEDVYAASLIYTDDALARIQQLMEQTITASQQIWDSLHQNMEQEMERVRSDKVQLRDQLQDFRNSKKYMAMIDDCNRQREQEEKKSKEAAKRIQNEAKHFPMKVIPEIKVNPEYFLRRGLKPDGTPLTEDTSEKTEQMDQEKPVHEVPEVKVNLDAEYFKQKKVQE